MTESNLLKHQLGCEAIEQIASSLKQADSGLNTDKFIRLASSGIEAFELKQRVTHIVTALGQTLPADFSDAADILQNVVRYWPTQEEQHNWHSFAAWPLIDYVKVHGLTQPQRSLQVLETLTPLFTAEFALRPFLEQHFELTYQQMLTWCEHDDEHVRRLASEGIRPRLPWASQLAQLRKDPSPIWPILNSLKTDSSAYVRRSVANNLNDISKDHPEQVISRCRLWQQEPHPHTDWIMRHGLRTLVKSGYGPVYPLLGFSADPRFKRLAFTLNQAQIQLGQPLQFQLELASENEPLKLVVDYQIAFVRADGRLSRKVFKWKNVSLSANSQLSLSKLHLLRALSTRKFYPGLHWLECLINGQVQARVAFELRLE